MIGDLSAVPQSILTMIGAAVGMTLVALIKFWQDHRKDNEQANSIYVNASDIVVENLAQEVKRLSNEIKNLHNEVVTLRGMVRHLGGDPYAPWPPDVAEA